MAPSPSGEPATAQPSAPGEPDVRPLDFSHPTKFTTELRRRIASQLESLAEPLSAALSAQLKAEVAVELGELDENGWAAARAALSPEAVTVGVQADLPEHGLLIGVEPGLVTQALECLLGGKAGQAPAERHLSEIDWLLARGVLDTVVAGLSETWSALGGGALTRGELDLDGDDAIEVAAAEPTLTVRFTSRIDGCSSGFCLLLPWRAVQPLTAARAPQPGAGSAPEAGALRDGLAVAEVLLRAEVGSVQMPIEQMSSIVAGSVLMLGERAESGVRLFAEEVSVGRGRPGRSGTHKAVKLEAADERPERAATYAKLGRAEIERARGDREPPSAADGSQPMLQSMFVRVWAELGRTHMALGRALELAPGAVVELDQAAERPVELFANGLCFASGSLLVGPDGNWGVSVENVL